MVLCQSRSGALTIAFLMKHCKMSLKTAFELVGERLSHAELKVPSAHLLSVVQKSGDEPCFQLLDCSGAVSSSCLIAALALVALCELWCAGECVRAEVRSDSSYQSEDPTKG